jgi:adenine-specific DNA methylase
MIAFNESRITFYDLFAGTSIVERSFKEKGYKNEII